MKLTGVAVAKLRPVGWLLQQVAIQLSERDGYAGLTLLRGGVPRDWNALRCQLRDALDLLRTGDERYLQRLARHTPRLMLYEGARHDYWRLTRTTLVQADLVENRSPMTIAVVLVGLSVHAELVNESPSAQLTRARQAMALKEQLSFARQFSPELFPGLEKLWAWLADSLREYEG